MAKVTDSASAPRLAVRDMRYQLFLLWCGIFIVYVCTFLFSSFKPNVEFSQAMDATWKVGKEGPSGWQNADFDDRAWPQAKVVARYGDSPWGNVARGPLTLGPVEADPYLGHCDVPSDLDLANVRVYLEMDELVPEEAARVTVNGNDAGGFIGAAVACRLNMTVFVPMWPVYFLLAVRPPRIGTVLRLCVVYCLAAGAVWGALHLVCLRAVDWSVPRLIAHVVREAMLTKYTYGSLCNRPWWYYFAPFGHDLPAMGVGLPMMLAAAAGMVWGRVDRRHRALWWTLIAAAGLYLLFLCNERIRLIRWASPLTPFVALSIALLLKRLYDVMTARGRRPVLAGLAAVGLMVVLIAKPIEQMVLFNLSAGERPTTLSAAKNWLKQHPEARYKVFGSFGWGHMETEYPYHYPATAFGHNFDRVMDVMDWIGSRVGIEVERPAPAARPDRAAIVGPVELMQRDRLDYIVVGGWRHDFLAATPDAYAHDAEIKRRLVAFADEARARLQPCARFAPAYAADWGMTLMGRQQTLEIYALPPAAAGAPAGG